MARVSSRSGRTLLDYLGISARGFCMGVADVVPGVSGGTMAFILGVYEELLDAIHSVNGRFLRLLFRFRFREAFDGFPYGFVLALVTGILVAIFSLARFFSWALAHHPVLVWAFFFGLVLASIITVRSKVAGWTIREVLALLLASASAFVLVGAVPVETTSAAWFVFPERRHRNLRNDPAWHLGFVHSGHFGKVRIHAPRRGSARFPADFAVRVWRRTGADLLRTRAPLVVTSLP